MGDIPASTNMISTIITNPAPGDTVPANTNFTVNLQVLNLEAGSFTNPDTTYYAAPQALKNGNIVGHTHITIQSLGDSITTSTPPDPAVFAFFKGVNDDGNGQGGLNATVAGGLAAGAYRVCTMTSASNHQPVLMPVAQRGAQDDCTKFVVTDGGAASAGTGGAASAGTGDDTSASSSTVAAAAATSSTAVVGTGSNSTVSTGSTTGGNTNSSGGNTNSSGGNTNSNGGNANSNGGNSNSNFNHHGGRRARYGRFAAREFVA
jgi:transcription initiation factor TFIID subunit 15